MIGYVKREPVTRRETPQLPDGQAGEERVDEDEVIIPHDHPLKVFAREQATRFISVVTVYLR